MALNATDTGRLLIDLDASDCVIFIHGRTNPTTYTVKMEDGLDPPDLGVADSDLWPLEIKKFII